MEAGLVVALVIGLFLCFVALEMPIAFAIILAASVGTALTSDLSRATTTLAAAPVTAVAKYSLFVIPMYVLLGSVIANSGIGESIYNAVSRLVGRFPGGVAATAVGATAVFSGISGSSAADVATFGRVSVDEMGKRGYPRPYAAAVVASAGAFAALIPPSVVLVIYGLLAEVSIAGLILAAVIPGALSAVALMAFVVFRARYWPPREPDGATSVTVETDRSRSATPPAAAPSSVASDLAGVAFVVVLFGLVVGGLYGGKFTATEAGAIGAAVALVGIVFRWRPRRESAWAIFTRSLSETAHVTSMIFFILIGGVVFTYFVASTGLPKDIALWISGLPVPHVVVVGLFLVLLLFFGAFLDGLSIMLLVVPIAAPVVAELGFDGIWFGILVIKMVEIGLITPPVGINVFIAAGITNVPAAATFRFIAPFVVLDLAVTGLLFAFPDVTLWLPRMAGVA